MKKMVLLGSARLMSLYILVLGTMETIKATSFEPTPAQFVDRLTSNFESFIEVLKKDIELIIASGESLYDPLKGSFYSYMSNDGIIVNANTKEARAYNHRVYELWAFADKQKLNAGHIWLPFMNESDKTLVQVVIPPPIPLLAEVSIIAQLFKQMQDYKIRPLTPLEFEVLSRRKIVYDIVTFQGIINFIPKDAKFMGTSIREMLTHVAEVGFLTIAWVPYTLLDSQLKDMRDEWRKWMWRIDRLKHGKIPLG